MSTANPTIRIAGAGPSGLCAAINLAKAGYWVERIECNKGMIFFQTHD